MASQTFTEKCYSFLKKVPKGKVTTYADLARALKSKAYRAVGNAMNKNQNAPIVPCHRVVRSNGEIGGYAGGPRKKIALLTKEGVKIQGGKVKDLNRYLYRFKSR